MSEPSVSVVIPTLNRASVCRSVRSALEQGPSVEVLLVDDSQAQDLVSPIPDPRIEVLRTGGRTGAAAARNLGMSRARGRFIAFLDDDDEWCVGHLDAALRVLQERPDRDIYSSRALVLRPDGQGRIEPVSMLGEEFFWDYTYGLASCWARGRRVLTPTLVFRATLKDHGMEPDLTWAEDTWWLLTAERLGHRIVQDARVGAIVHAADDRRYAREQDDSNLTWARRLDEHRPGAGAMHLAALGRTAAKHGRSADVWRRAQEARSLARGARLLPIFAAELGLAAVMRVVRPRTRREGSAEG